MIRDVQVSEDAAGFPIVSWTEDRNLSSPEWMTGARVECRIMKDKDTGVLQFVARGTVRHGSFEEGKPWERLRAFSTRVAGELYATKAQVEFHQVMASKSVGGKMALNDSARVFSAEFLDGTVLHINCADAAPVEIDGLHVTLTREFVAKRDQLVGNLCSVAFEWPAGDDRVMTYEPARSGWCDQGKLGILLNALDWVLAVSVVAAVGAFVVWQLGGLRGYG